MTVEEIMTELQSLGKESIKKVLINHGAKEPFFGVSVEDLKKIQKKIRRDHDLAIGLYATGNSDAMYLSGLIADDAKMTKAELQTWVEGAYWYMLSEYTVPWVAAESLYGLELALEWIESPSEQIASAGWATLSSLVTIKKDSELDIALLGKLLKSVEKKIHALPNRVRHCMNGFVIAAGCSVLPLTELALIVAKKIGKVAVEQGGKQCKVPLAEEYILNAKTKGTLGKKRKTAKC